MQRLLLLTLSFSLLSLLPPAGAQVPTADALYGFAFENVPGQVNVPTNQLTIVSFTFHDRSNDSPTFAVPGAPVVPASGHTVNVRITPGLPDPDGWVLGSISSFTSVAGEVRTLTFSVIPSPLADSPRYLAKVNATITTIDGSVHYAAADILLVTDGSPGFDVQSGGFIAGLAPREVRTASLVVNNRGVYPRLFHVETGTNPCNIKVAPPPDFVVLARSEATVQFSIEGPTDSPYYQGDSCSIGLLVSPLDHSDVRIGAVVSVTVSGFYVDPLLVFWAVAGLLLLLLLLLLLKRRKEKLDEELLGKPQKPWTIPVEQVYLRHLKAKDERAWYVVRHFLMEDEYRSALLWYKSHKKGTRGARKRERLILRQEKAYARWKAKRAKRIAKPLRKADKWEAKLQRKLDRKADKVLRKETRKWRKLVAKLEVAHGKELKRAEERHAKEVRRAGKKGLPAPKAPVLAPPDLPPEPELVPLVLAEHRWARKAARWRRAMVKRQGNLEVRFERADARRLRKVERKMQRIARKLDDPAFVEEHPLLKRAARPAKKPA